jgi:hypothetical protein
MADLLLTGNKKIKSVRKEFTAKFNFLHIRFYTEADKFVDDNATIASVRKVKGNIDLSIVGNLGVGTLETRCKEIYGFNVEVILAKKAGKGYTTSKTEGALDKMSLTQLNNYAKENGYADMTAWADSL